VPLEPEGNFPFLSPEWEKMTKFTVQKAKELGIRVDFMLGTGWPYGGPWITLSLLQRASCVLWMTWWGRTATA